MTTAFQAPRATPHICPMTPLTGAHSFEQYMIDTFCDSQYLSQRKHHTHLHRAVIVKRGKILAEATNLVGTRSSGAGYSASTIHAERAVVKKLGDTNKLRGADLYVFRVGATAAGRYSQPCTDCQNFLKKCIREYGLRFVFYSV